MDVTIVAQAIRERFVAANFANDELAVWLQQFDSSWSLDAIVDRWGTWDFPENDPKNQGFCDWQTPWDWEPTPEEWNAIKTEL